MTSKFLSICALILLGATCICAQGNICDKRITIHIKQAPFYIVAGTLVEDFDVPIGLELSPSSVPVDDLLFEYNLSKRLPVGFGSPWPIRKDNWRRPEKYRFTLDFDKARLSDVLDAIVKQMPGDEWESDESVVNIWPKVDRDPRIVKLLGVRIASFESSPDTEIWDLMVRFTATAEIKQFQNELAVVIPTSVENGGLNLKGKLNGMFHFEGLTVKELLNAILKVKRGGWIVRMDRWPENDQKGTRGIVVNF